MRESNNKRNHADTQAMVISSAAGELTLGIGLGFVSVGDRRAGVANRRVALLVGVVLAATAADDGSCSVGW